MLLLQIDESIKVVVVVVMVCTGEDPRITNFYIDLKLSEKLCKLAYMLIHCLPRSLYSSVDLLKLTRYCKLLVRCHISLILPPKW